MLKVSIIIPIYKVESYIKRCINSVLYQTYRQVEIILVDDCSPDHSLDIAKQIIEKSEKSKDLEIFYLKHEKNRGLSAARNTGIKAAKGDYIYLLDSDDEITPICIEKLISLVQKYPGVNIVQGNTLCNDERYKWLDLSTKNLPEYSLNKQWIRKQFINVEYNLKDNVPVTAWNKLFNRKWFVDNNLWYKEGLIHEDEHWRLMYWKHIKSIAFCNDITYNYYVRKDSIVTSQKSNDKREIAFLSIYNDYLPTIGDYSKREINLIVQKLYKKGRIIDNLSHPEDYLSLYNRTMRKVAGSKQLPWTLRFLFYYLSFPKSLVKWKIVNSLLSLINDES